MDDKKCKMTVILERWETKEVSAKICSGLLPGEFSGCSRGRGTQRELENLPEIRQSLEVRDPKMTRFMENREKRAAQIELQRSAENYLRVSINTDQCMFPKALKRARWEILETL